MKKLCTILCALLFITSCFAIEFEFYNNTDFDILHIYVIPADGDRRSRDLLDPLDCVAPLESRSLYVYIPDGENAEIWTLICVESGGHELAAVGIPLRTVDSVSLEWSVFYGVQWEAE